MKKYDKLQTDYKKRILAAKTKLKSKGKFVAKEDTVALFEAVIKAKDIV